LEVGRGNEQNTQWVGLQQFCKIIWSDSMLAIPSVDYFFLEENLLKFKCYSLLLCFGSSFILNTFLFCKRMVSLWYFHIGIKGTLIIFTPITLSCLPHPPVALPHSSVCIFMTFCLFICLFLGSDSEYERKICDIYLSETSLFHW
jgi:hypothetical protein